MRTKRRNTASAVAAVAMLALVLGSQPAARAAADEPPGGAQSEGIKVHGHWTIDVLNRDGSLVSHHVFQNALANHLGASTFLNGVLSRTKRVGKWKVALPDQAGQPLIWIVEPGYPGFAADNPALSVSAPTSGPNAGKLVFSGSASASRAAQITWVQTETQNCPPPGDPGQCVGDFAFTQKNLPSPIPVAEGQIVQLTVVFTFS
jgi:hypothetical protein